MSSTAMVAAICADLPSVAEGPVSGTWKPILMSACAGIVEASPRISALAKPMNSFLFRTGVLGIWFTMAFSIERGVTSRSLDKPIFAQYFAGTRQPRPRRPRQFPVAPVVLFARRIDAELADGAIPLEGLGTIGANAG